MSIRAWYDSDSESRSLTPHVVSRECQKALDLHYLSPCKRQTHTDAEVYTFQAQWSLQFNMNYLKQTLGSAGQPSVWGECLMIAFYCSRRSRSSKLSFCSLRGTRAAAVRIHSALCFYTRGEVGQAHSHWNVFTGGRHSVDTIILLFCPFVLESVERVNSFGWDVTSLGFDADQIAFLAWFSIIGMCVNERVRVWIGFKNRPPLGL